MKTYFKLSTILFLALHSTVSAQDSKKSEAGKKTVSIQTSIYCSHCKKCETCKARVENKVYELKGIRSVEMNVDKQTIVVVYNSKHVDEQKIKEQIAATGYDADDVKATAAQVAGLDDCCRKQ